MKSITERRCRVYKLNVMDSMTDAERNYYDVIDQNRNKQNFDKQFWQDKLKKEIKKFPDGEVRKISKKYLYLSDDDGNCTETENLKRQIVLSENEIIRRCNVDLTDVPLISQIVIMKSKSELMIDVLNQIIDRGVDIDGVHYIFYTSSTNQMKNAEITLLEEKFWNENKSGLMCGLTEDIINSKGGINMGKFFSAKALNMSNSIAFDSGVNIDEVIIVKDFKTLVSGMVNYLDIDTLNVTEQEKSIPIEHMDGAGMFIPGTFPCSCQIRGGWLKGAIFPFDFHAFIEKYESKLSEVHMLDAWDDVVTIEEFMSAKLILTDSQLKMRKYYNSMTEYREKFKESRQSITINNWAHEPNKSGEVRVAYQPFQTIPRKNITDDAIASVTKKTIEYINGAKNDPKTALRLMGVDVESADDTMEQKEMNVLHAAILKYPSLLQDVHVKKSMQSALLSERNKAMGCKMIMDGIWSYVCPDLYAFCQWLFLGEDNPDGLIQNGHVYNNYYKDTEVEEVCCIRYPHLSDCEHGIRKIEKTSECAEWFNGYDTIVSCHDLISKTLQCDWDGDHICLVHDKSFLNILDRKALPLLYEMTKAEPSQICNDGIMKCLTSSFSNENIGFVSNAITKIFNSVDEPNINLVRVLCAYNNYVIDYFKTQKRMDLKEYSSEYEKYKSSDGKCPHFFRYAKKKKKDACEEFNPKGNCDRISKYVKDKTRKDITKTKYVSEENDAEDMFNPEMLKRKDAKINRKSKEYIALREVLAKLKITRINQCKKISRHIKNSDNLEAKFSDDELYYFDCVNQISNIISDRRKATDYLVDVEYYQEENADSKKDILWNCYGDIVYTNICNNAKDNTEAIPVKRNSYMSRSEKIKEVEKCIEEAEKEILNTERVSISQNEYDSIMNIKSRKNRQNDKYILFIIYVLLKRFQKRYGDKYNYVRIYKRAKQRKITRAAIDSWIGSECTNKGLIQLEKNGYIKTEECQRYTKVFVKMVFELNEDEKELFSVAESNPLIDLFKYNGDRKTRQCEICKKWFVASGNNKTCSDKCSNHMRKMNKNGKQNL